MNESGEDYFELKYLEEISELFNEFKEIDNYYGLNLLNDNYCLFYEFIQDNVVIIDFDEEELDEDEDENI